MVLAFADGMFSLSSVILRASKHSLSGIYTYARACVLCVCVFKILRQTIWNSLNNSTIIHKIITLMEVKTQEQVLKLYSACVVIISIQRK